MNTEEQIKSDAIKEIFDVVGKFVIIGLTGRTGSGCSTVAEILSKDFDDINPPNENDSHFTDNEERKYKILRRYAEKEWDKFTWIKVSGVIASFIFDKDFNEFVEFNKNQSNPKLKDLKNINFDKLEIFFNKIKIKYDKYKSPKTRQKDRIGSQLFIAEMPKFSIKLKEILQQHNKGLYTKYFQQLGDNIRASGSSYSSEFSSKNIFDLADRVNNVIKHVRHIKQKSNKPCRIVVDSIRNPYEALFFKERYSDFYLTSVNVEDEKRRDYLRNGKGYTEEEIIEIDYKEYPEESLKGVEILISQNIKKCLEMTDIHLHNPTVQAKDRHDELAAQILWYVTLMLHPGLIPPTADERVMQLAYAAKISSGCISRQVGAVVIDKETSVKAIGWNSTPRGQVPCILRSAEDLLDFRDKDAYSDFEINDKNFRDGLKKKYGGLKLIASENGRNLSFCFKDLHNEIQDKDNQVHTRSMHAEENAFMQITKNGGAGVDKGILFTTASPCELCSKKAYQLGISRIVYIDPYPGIAAPHVLNVGDPENRPNVDLFRGAVGAAYFKLYMPIIPYKDELKTLLNVKSVRKKSK